MIRYKFEYGLTRLVGFFGKIMPLSIAHFCGDLLGDLFFYLIRIRKKVALRNLKASLGSEKSDRELKRILRRNYRHLGRVLMEFARIPQLTRESISEQIPICNVEYLERLKKQQRPFFVLSGHFGNWEYMAAAVANYLSSLYCVFKEQKNLAVDKIIKDFRISMGLRPFKVKGDAARGILKAFKENQAVLILFDQDAGGKGMMVDFLGRPASTATGPAKIAIKHRVPVVMAFGVRGSDGKIKIQLEKFPDIHQFPDNDDGVKQFIVEYNKILEKYIRTYPEQWFWMHRRWKTQKK